MLWIAECKISPGLVGGVWVVWAALVSLVTAAHSLGPVPVSYLYTDLHGIS